MSNLKRASASMFYNMMYFSMFLFVLMIVLNFVRMLNLDSGFLIEYMFILNFIIIVFIVTTLIWSMMIRRTIMKHRGI